MGKGFLAVVGIVFCMVMASSAFAECFVTLGQGELGCEGLPLKSCGLASLPDENQILDIYCSQDYALEVSYLSEPAPSLVYSIFVELE